LPVLSSAGCWRSLNLLRKLAFDATAQRAVVKTGEPLGHTSGETA
jgi:hypothetical protein